MTLTSFIQITVNGLVLSFMYIFIAVGLSVIFSMLRIVTFAHGEMYMLGAYFTWLFCTQLGFPYIVAVGLAVAVMFIVGIGLERTLWQPMINDHLRCLIMSLGLCLILQGGAGAIFGAMDKGILSIFRGVFRIYGISLSVERIALVGVSLLVLCGMLLFFKMNKVGLAMRAVALDPAVASLQGIPVDKIQRLGFGMGCALAAFAGGLNGAMFSITPTMGLTPIVKAFVVVILGGLGSIPGAVIAGLIIGMLDSFSVTLFGSIGNMFAFIIFVIFLLVRPRGIMGYEV